MRIRPHAFVIVIGLTTAVGLRPAPVETVGRPGITPVACSPQAWIQNDPAFEALPAAKAFFGTYEGGVYRIEIPTRWNGELMLSAHGFVSSGDERGSELRVGFPDIREHLIASGLCVGGVELSMQRVRAGHRPPGHDGAHRPVHEIQWGRRAAARVPDRHLNGRPRHAARHARISDGFRGRPGDVSGRPGAVRLLHSGRRCRGGGHRPAVQGSWKGAADAAVDDRGARAATRLHREGPAARQRGDPPERRAEAVCSRGARIQVSAEHQRRRPRRQFLSFQPRRHEPALRLSNRRGARAHQRAAHRAGPAQGAGPGDSRGAGTVRRAGAVRRTDRAAGADNARDGRSLRADSSRTDTQSCGRRGRAIRISLSSGSTGSPATAGSASPSSRARSTISFVGSARACVRRATPCSAI